MNTIPMTTATAAGLAVAATRLSAAERQDVDQLIQLITDKDDKVRGPAWQSAAPYGAPAVKPLAATMTHGDFEIARAAKRALWKIVRHAGRPGADQERKAVGKELVDGLQNPATSVRREVLWMLSEIGGDNAVPAVAALLSDREVREDARAALERIPGDKSLAALQSGLTTVAEEFRPAVAQSLRVRGVPVAGYPSQKLVPTRLTTTTG